MHGAIVLVDRQVRTAHLELDRRRVCELHARLPLSPLPGTLPPWLVGDLSGFSGLALPRVQPKLLWASIGTLGFGLGLTWANTLLWISLFTIDQRRIWDYLFLLSLPKKKKKNKNPQKH